MKSFFARTIDNGGFLAEREFGAVKFVPNKGKEKRAKVMFLTGKVVDAPGLDDPPAAERKKDQQRLESAKKAKKPAVPPHFSLRAKLIETALAPEQRDYFARAIVNRICHKFMGYGLVMPLDQMHSANPSSHPELLQWLARDLIDHGYDLRRLVHGLVLSRAYARSSRWDGDDVPEAKYFAVAQVRPLAPMPLATSLRLAAANPDKLPRAQAELEKAIDNLERRAAGLTGQFVQPGDNFQVGVAEALLFANNEGFLRDVLGDGSDSLIYRLKQVPEADRRVSLAVRSVLSRAARPDEMQALTSYLQRRTDRPDEGCRQIVWALLTSAEFRFNH
jgi:hypothetical protein